MEFEGIDYTELAEPFGVSKEQIEEWDDDDIDAKKLGDIIWDAVIVHTDHGPDANEKIQILRDFLEALIGESSGNGNFTPFFRGIQAIRDGYTFCQVFVHNLGLLWN